MGKEFFHTKIFKAGVIIILSSVILVGTIVPIATANFSNEIYLRINGKKMGIGDEKLILFVDVPTYGGKATNFVFFEVKSNGLRDNWDFFDVSSTNEHKYTIDLHSMDFIIVVNSDSNGNEKWDTFNIQLAIKNSNIESYTYSYNFGEDRGNHLRVGIWQIAHTNDVSLFNIGNTVYCYDASEADYYTEHYDPTDWLDGWSYFSQYFYSGDESFVSSLILNFDFPAPIIA